MAARSQRLVAGADGLTDAHSKSPRNDTAMKPLLVACYNSAHEHETLNPSEGQRLSDYVWTIKELIERAAEA
jgi:hypothetical protein